MASDLHPDSGGFWHFERGEAPRSAGLGALRFTDGDDEALLLYVQKGAVMESVVWTAGAVLLGLYIAACTGGLVFWPLLAQALNDGLPDHPWVVGGTLAAGIAALFGILSFVAIIFQIRLANRQIDLAKDELKAVKEDLEIAREGRALVQMQVAEAQRKPNVAVCFSDGRASGIEAGTDTEGLKLLRLYLVNTGSRTARNVYATLFIPAELYSTKLGDPPKNLHHIDGGEYMMIPFVTQTVWPSNTPDYSATWAVSNVPGKWPIYWRVYDDSGRYPEDGSYGKLEFTLP